MHNCTNPWTVAFVIRRRTIYSKKKKKSIYSTYISGNSSSSMVIVMKLFPLLSFLFFTLGAVLSSPQRYESVFNFGDSLSDTGNFLLSGALAFPVIGKLPYGETFFQHATGRCSDGRLVVDFIGILTCFCSSFIIFIS